MKILSERLYSPKINDLAEIVRESEELVRDIEFRKLKEYHHQTGIPLVAYFPVYTPVEILEALEIIPLGLHGAGNEIEILHADARFGSFICSIVKTTMELGLTGQSSFVDGFLYSGICDSARNLAFIYERNFPQVLVHFLRLPQNCDSNAAIPFLTQEYRQLIVALEERFGRTYSEDKLRQSIAKYNENRRLQNRLYEIRRAHPGKLSIYELYSLIRVGNYVLVDEHNDLLQQVLHFLDDRPEVKRDRVKVIIEGSFCEQPPYELLKLLDDVGCHLLDDDFVLGRRLFLTEIPTDPEPLSSMAEAYLRHSSYSSVRHCGQKTKTSQFLEKIQRYSPEAVIFLYAKFCEPGLFDYVLFKNALEEAKIPHLFLEFEEKMWNFDRAQLEIETFIESLVFVE